jgi:osmotically inducible protein OsmC
MISSESGVLTDTAYSFHTRFENEKGTNPEELIAAAHSGCYSMALSAGLANAGFVADRIETNSGVKLETVDGAPTVVESHLTVSASVPGIDDAKFQEVAAETKANCPISRLLKCEITLEAKLV